MGVVSYICTLYYKHAIPSGLVSVFWIDKKLHVLQHKLFRMALQKKQHINGCFIHYSLCIANNQWMVRTGAALYKKDNRRSGSYAYPRRGQKQFAPTMDLTFKNTNVFKTLHATFLQKIHW